MYCFDVVHEGIRQIDSISTRFIMLYVSIVYNILVDIIYF